MLKDSRLDPDPPTSAAVEAQLSLSLVPGAIIADRYRLLERQPSVGWAQWWYAHEMTTARVVSLTVVHVDVLQSRDLSPNAVQRFIDATLAACVAKKPEVVLAPPYVLLVDDLPPSKTLEDFAPVAPAVAARCVRNLAQTVQSVHHTGSAVSLDHHTRVRIADDGRPVLAFPAARFGATMKQDVVGLGAVLYTLLVGEWPHGRCPVPPGPLGAVADAAGSGSLGTAQEFIAELDSVAAAAAVAAEDGPPAVIATPRNRALSILVAALVLIVFGAVGWFVSTMVFGGGYGAVDSAVSVPTPKTTTQAPVVEPRPPVLPVDAQAWSGVRSPDNADNAVRAVDANPSTSWSTDRYRTPFGTSENGIGVVVSFGETADVGQVWITTPHPGAVVEIRTPPERGKDLKSTRVLGSGVLGSGATTIELDPPADSSALMIWVAELAPVGSQFVADFAEIGFVRA